MATINAGSSGRLDMQALQLAQLQYGNVPIYDASRVRIDNGGGRYVDFEGAFAYPTGGGGGPMPDPYGYTYDYGGGTAGADSYYPSSGSISRIVEAGPAGTTLEATGLAIDAPTLFNLARASSFDALVNLVFGGSDQLTGGAAADWIDGYGGDDAINGGAGADFVRGLDGADTIDGGLDADDVNGNRGEDVVHGGDGADLVRGGQGVDTVHGDAGDDVHVNGNIGDDLVFGGAGADTVFGGQDQDRLFGEDGDDLLSGDLGADTLTGGAGADRFTIRPGAGADLVTDFNAAEGDRVQLAAGQAFTTAAVGGGIVLDIGGAQLTLMGATAGDWVVFV
jgi:Ca2+-binding RTX toxin-like protein